MSAMEVDQVQIPDAPEQPHALKTWPIDIQLATAAHWAWEVDPNRPHKLSQQRRDFKQPPLFLYRSIPTHTKHSEKEGNEDHFKFSFWSLGPEATAHDPETKWKATIEPLDEVLKRMYKEADKVMQLQLQSQDGPEWLQDDDPDVQRNKQYLYLWVHTSDMDAFTPMTGCSGRLHHFLPSWGIFVSRGAQLGLLDLQGSGYRRPKTIGEYLQKALDLTLKQQQLAGLERQLLNLNTEHGELKTDIARLKNSISNPREVMSKSNNEAKLQVLQKQAGANEKKLEQLSSEAGALRPEVERMRAHVATLLAENEEYPNFTEFIDNFMRTVHASYKEDSVIGRFCLLCKEYCENGIVDKKDFDACALDAMLDGSFDMTALWTSFLSIARPTDNDVPNLYKRLTEPGSPTEFHIFDAVDDFFPFLVDSKNNRRVGALRESLHTDFLRHFVSGLITIEETRNKWWDKLYDWSRAWLRKTRPSTIPDWFTEDSVNCGVTTAPHDLASMPPKYRYNFWTEFAGKSTPTGWILDVLRNTSSEAFGLEGTSVDDRLIRIGHNELGFEMYPPRNDNRVSYRRELTHQIRTWNQAVANDSRGLNETLMQVAEGTSGGACSSQGHGPDREAFGLKVFADIDRVLGFSSKECTEKLKEQRGVNELGGEAPLGKGNRMFAEEELDKLKSLPVKLGEVPAQVKAIMAQYARKGVEKGGSRDGVKHTVTSGWAAGRDLVGIDIAPDLAVEARLQKRTYERLMQLLEACRSKYGSLTDLKLKLLTVGYGLVRGAQQPKIDAAKKVFELWLKPPNDPNESDGWNYIATTDQKNAFFKDLRLYLDSPAQYKGIRETPQKDCDYWKAMVQERLTALENEKKQVAGYFGIPGVNRFKTDSMPRWTDAALTSARAGADDWKSHPVFRYVAQTTANVPLPMPWDNQKERKEQDRLNPPVVMRARPISDLVDNLRRNLRELEKRKTAKPDLNAVLHYVQECENVAEALFVRAQQELLISQSLVNLNNPPGRWPKTRPGFMDMMLERPLTGDNEKQREGARKGFDHHKTTDNPMLNKWRFWAIGNPLRGKNGKASAVRSLQENKGDFKVEFNGKDVLLQTMHLLLFAMQEIGQVLRFGGFRMETGDETWFRNQVLTAWRSVDPSNEDKTRPMQPLTEVDPQRAPWLVYGIQEIREDDASFTGVQPREMQKYFKGLLDSDRPDCRTWKEKMYGDEFEPPKWNLRPADDFWLGTQDHEDMFSSSNSILNDFVAIFGRFASTFYSVENEEFETQFAQYNVGAMDPSVAALMAVRSHDLKGFMRTLISKTDTDGALSVRPPFLSYDEMVNPPPKPDDFEELETKGLRALDGNVEAWNIGLIDDELFQRRATEALQRMYLHADDDAHTPPLNAPIDLNRGRWGGADQPEQPTKTTGSQFTNEEELSGLILPLIEGETYSSLYIDLATNSTSASMTSLKSAFTKMFGVGGFPAPGAQQEQRKPFLLEYIRTYKHSRLLAMLDYKLRLKNQQDILQYASKFIATKMLDILKRTSERDHVVVYEQAKAEWFSLLGDVCKKAGRAAFELLENRVRVNACNKVIVELQSAANNELVSNKNTPVVAGIHAIWTSIRDANMGNNSVVFDDSIFQGDAKTQFDNLAKKLIGKKNTPERVDVVLRTTIKNCLVVDSKRKDYEIARERAYKEVFNLWKMVNIADTSKSRMLAIKPSLPRVQGPKKRGSSEQSGPSFLDPPATKRGAAVNQQQAFLSADVQTSESERQWIALASALYDILGLYEEVDTARYQKLEIEVFRTCVRLSSQTDTGNIVSQSAFATPPPSVEEELKRGIAYVRMRQVEGDLIQQLPWRAIHCGTLYKKARDDFTQLKNAVDTFRAQEETYKTAVEVNQSVAGGEEQQSHLRRMQTLVNELNAQSLRRHDRACEFLLRLINLVNERFFSPSLAMAEIKEFRKTNAMPADEDDPMNIVFDDLLVDLELVHNWEWRWRSCEDELEVLRDADYNEKKADTGDGQTLMDLTYTSFNDSASQEVVGYDIRVPTTSDEWKGLRFKYRDNAEVTGAMEKLEASNKRKGRNPAFERYRPLIRAIDTDKFPKYNHFLKELCLSPGSQQVREAFANRERTILQELTEDFSDAVNRNTVQEDQALFDANPVIVGEATKVSLHVALELQREFSTLQRTARALRSQVILEGDAKYEEQYSALKTRPLSTADQRIYNATLRRRLEAVEDANKERIQADLEAVPRTGWTFEEEFQALKHIADMYAIDLYARATVVGDGQNRVRVYTEEIAKAVANLPPTALYNQVIVEAVSNQAAAAASEKSLGKRKAQPEPQTTQPQRGMMGPVDSSDDDDD